MLNGIAFGRDQSQKVGKVANEQGKGWEQSYNEIFHKIQFDYPQLLSCHEAVGVPSAKKWNQVTSNNGHTLDVELELNLVIIVIKDLI